MTLPIPPWLSLALPWHTPAPVESCRAARVSPDAVPVLDTPPAASMNAAELIALRSGRYVPLFGLGVGRPELARALGIAQRTFGTKADARALEHASVFLTHPALGADALSLLADAVTERAAPTWAATLTLGLAGAVGASDALRAQVAHAFAGIPALATEVSLALDVGGGDLGAWREHYQRLRVLDASAPPMRAASVARHWFDFVLARRWHGLDELRAMRAHGGLDASSSWLAASADWIAGEEKARSEMTDVAQTALEPIQQLPRLVQTTAREMVELLSHPWTVRWEHLRCAAARDHGAASIRAWLHAAAEERFFEDTPGESVGGHAEFGELGPEPSRAGRAASEARQLAGDFLLDWFVHEREARAAVDDWARLALRIYHRLRGAAMLEVALRGAREDGFPLGDATSSEPPR